jgi:hypothetical protein
VGRYIKGRFACDPVLPPLQYERHKRVEIVVEGVALTLEVFERVRQTKHVPMPTERREIDRGHSYMVPTYDFHSRQIRTHLVRRARWAGMARDP